MSLLLTTLILMAAPPQTPAPGEELLREIETNFPAAKKWFGMVADLEWDRDQAGALTPRPGVFSSRFVLKQDPAGQALSARLPGVVSGPHEVFVPEVHGFSVRTRELGLAAVPAEVMGGLVVYRGAIAGGDLLYKLTPTHLDEYLYLRTPPASLRREFEFDTGGAVAWLRESGRMIEVLGRDGTARLRLGAPVARAADGTRRVGTIRLEGRRLIAELELSGLAAPILVDPDWTTTGTMTVAHWADFGWRKADGRVMAVAGCALASCPVGLATSNCNQILSVSDVWSTTSGVWTGGPSVNVGRYSFAGVELPGGSLLIAGGCTVTGCAGQTDTAERYDPSLDQFVLEGALPHPVGNLTGAPLPGGGALMVGGCDSSACYADASRYAAGAWTPAAPLSAPRGYHTTTALSDGKILVIGGCADPACAAVLPDAELYDPSTNTWRSAGVMTTTRAGHTATLLADGSVLVTGGCSRQSCKGTTLGSSELWKADALRGGAFSAGPAMNAPRHHHTATLLDSGQVMVAGGTDGTDATRSASEVYLPRSKRFFQAPRMMMSRAYHVAVGLSSGEVLVGGGCNPATCLPWAEVFSPVGLPIELADGGVTLDAGTTPPVEEPFDAGEPFVVKGGPHPKLYRSGVFSCSTDEVQDLPCPVPGWPAQDGEFQPNSRAMVPQAGGEVHDEATGLTWQARDDGQTYTWAQAGAACEASGWRLPSVVELMTINHYGKIGPSIDQAFPDTQQTNYWTSTRVAGASMLAWTVKFDAGEVVPLLEDTALPVRCVKGAISAAHPPEGHLRLAGPLSATDDTVRDDANLVEWQRRDDGVKRTWRQSLDYCAKLNLAGHDDWHMPNPYELLSIVEYGSDAPVKLDPLFQEGKADIYWTGTFNEGIPTLSWSVTFNLGVIDGVTYSGQAYARCVRHMATPVPVKPCGCSSVEGGLGVLVLLGLLRRRVGVRGRPS